MPAPRLSMPFGCCAPEIGFTPEAVIRVPPNSSLTEHLLDRCLSIDDVNLKWLCEAIFRARPSVLQQLLQSILLEKPPTDSAFQPNSLVPSLEGSDTEKEAADLEQDCTGRCSDGMKEEKLPAPAFQHMFALPSVTEDAPSRANAENNPPSLSAPGLDVVCHSMEDIDVKDGLDIDFVSPQGLAREADTLLTEFIQRDRDVHGPKPGRRIPLVQFESLCVHCDEGGRGTECYVVRLGTVDSFSSVDFETFDGTAIAGVHYVAMSGTVVFEIGETKKLITIEPINGTSWMSSSDMFIRLLSDGAVNACLVGALSVCTCHIIEDDTFPTNRFKSDVLMGKTGDVNGVSLMIEYLKNCLLQKNIRIGVFKLFWLEMYRSVYIILVMLLRMLLIDRVLCAECDANVGLWNLSMVIIAQTGPCAFLSWLDTRKSFWKIKGTARSQLLLGMVHKFLHFEAVSLASISDGKMVAAMTRDSEEAINKGLSNCPMLIAGIVRWVMVFIYMVSCSMVETVVTETASLWSREFLVAVSMCISLFAVLPIIKLVFFKMRHATTIASIEVANAAGDRLLETLDEIMDTSDLIRDYGLKDAFMSRYDCEVTKLNSARAYCDSIIAQNRIFAVWCTLSLQAFFLFLGGTMVLDGRMRIGIFLNTLSIIKIVGQLWGDVYDYAVEIQLAFDSLRAVVKFLNLPSNFKSHLFLESRRRQHMLEQEKDHLNHGRHPNVDVLDKLYLKFWRMTCRFNESTHTVLPSEAKPNRLPSLVLPQGGLYAFVGPPCSGKGTFLRMLADVLIRFDGFFDIPLHLRRIHVSQCPLFLDGSLLFNLTFGCKNEELADVNRVLSICRTLGMPPTVLELIDRQEHIERWESVLSSTESAMVHIARGIIANPEMLLVHKPGAFFNNEQGAGVYRMLKDFVINRGIELDTKSIYDRRPRTCFITARRLCGAGSRVADACIYVTQEDGMKLIRRQSEQKVSA
eukprot:TRINITY_DN50835_c0_g1_i1.p1 TRINITY_DN50835_c0_g1~~TRINITY_DN50835_c0_g1_i1.p1  ORF type:complete len:970 (-),score=116.83 TRINITY_DN50835_c0_g1_i1:109-3018(-)